jgi:hypothetical protein
MVPGPGVYEIKSKGIEGPCFSFRPKHKDKAADSVPGPGNYEPNPSAVKEKPPSWALGKSQKNEGFNVDKHLPGPGSYIATSTLSGPKWAFGNSKRGKSAELASPGPGTYEIKPLLGATPTYIQIPK